MGTIKGLNINFKKTVACRGMGKGSFLWTLCRMCWSTTENTHAQNSLPLCILCRVKRAPPQVLQGVFHVFTTCSLECFSSEIFEIPPPISSELITPHPDMGEDEKNKKDQHAAIHTVLGLDAR